MNENIERSRIAIKAAGYDDGNWKFESKRRDAITTILRIGGKSYHADGINDKMNFIMEAERGQAIENHRVMLDVHKATLAKKGLLLTVPFEYMPPRKSTSVKLFTLVKELYQEMHDAKEFKVPVILIGYDESCPTHVESVRFL